MICWHSPSLAYHRVHVANHCCLLSLQTRPLGLNSIHCNPARPWQFAVAGSDAYVRVYDRRKAAAASGGDEEDGAEPTPQQTRSYATALATPVSIVPTITDMP